MKFLKILKDYNQAIIKENQKLKSIYETLLKESEGDDSEVETECDVSEDDVETEAEDDAEKDGKNEASKKEEDVSEADEMMTAEEFFKEADADTDENAKDDVNEVLGALALPAAATAGTAAAVGGLAGAALAKENDEMMSAEEFFKEADADTDENAKDDVNEVEPLTLGLAAAGGALLGSKLTKEAEGDDDKDPVDKSDKDEASKKEEDVSEADEMMTAEEFFDIANESDSDETASEDDKDDVSETEELMTAEEFFKEAECPKCGKDPCECPVDEAKKTDKDEASEKEEEVSESDKDEDTEKDPVDESEDDDKELAESLKQYRKNNAHLFND